ncbi:MAG: hypothetical protein K9M75_06565 [Phycisphaerae bacterium]|nr:hypothetical protein [Phycisphaerae bacterium]
MQYDRVKSLLINNWFNLILIVCSLYVAIYHNLHITKLDYKGGLVNDATFSLFSFLDYLLSYAISSIIFIIIVVHLVRVLIKVRKTKKSDWIKISLCIFAFLPLSTILPIFPQKAGVILFFNGYEKWVAKEVDISAIREWLVHLPDEYSGQGYNNIEQYPGKLPEAITSFKPQFMQFSNFNNGRYVEFEWGGGLVSWGIRIGMEDMETPKEGFIMLNEVEFEYRRPIQPGVYIFDRSSL